MSQVCIRMYRPGGLGDCFLLSFPKKKGMAHMLIDCGVLTGTKDAKARMQAIVRDITETTKGLDVLAVTHEHWDHVSGFVQAKDEFENLPIGETWLAWTEKPNDDLAESLGKERKKAKRTVRAAIKRLRLSGAPATLAAVQTLSDLSQFFGARGSNSTEAIMAWLRDSARGRIRWLQPGDDPLSIPGVDGIRVFVLGPPRDPKLLRRSDPSKRTPEVYQLAGGMDLGFTLALVNEEGVDSGRPFDPMFETAEDEAKRDSEFKSFYDEHYFSVGDWRHIELDWLHTAEQLALKLDSDTNNTSLVLAIELIESGRVLLFTGDAQVGNWLSWESEACSWNVKDRNGEITKIKSGELLTRTVFYKVGHHGSHNATLKDKGLELMGSDELSAMIPVYEKQAHKQGRYGWEMPFPPLLKELLKKTSGRLARADTGVKASRVARQAIRYVENKDYIDCFVDI